MGNPLGLKYIPYTYMDPLGNRRPQRNLSLPGPLPDATPVMPRSDAGRP